MKQVCSSKDLYINSNYIKHHIGNNHFTGQQQIVEYLKQGKCIASAAGRAKDIFTGKTINEELTFMTDGKYEWRSDIAYYVEKYNLRLSKDFEDYVLELSSQMQRYIKINFKRRFPVQAFAWTLI